MFPGSVPLFYYVPDDVLDARGGRSGDRNPRSLFHGATVQKCSLCCLSGFTSSFAAAAAVTTM